MNTIDNISTKIKNPHISENELIKTMQEIDDIIVCRGYQIEQVIRIAQAITEINILSMRYEAREEVINTLCDEVSYYDRKSSIDLSKIISIKYELEDDLQKYIEDYLE